MAILAGIDEAGFGPILGPLVISGVAFEVPDERIGDCLWKVLRRTCASRKTRAGRRLVIADSKMLYRPPCDLAPLERAALVMLAVAGRRPVGGQDLIDALSPGVWRLVQRYPWYQDASAALPLSERLGDVATRANAVGRDCRANGVSLQNVVSEIVPERDFNRLAKSTGNKSVLLLGKTLGVMDRLIRSVRGDYLRLQIDRIGGRIQYRDTLSTAYPHYALRILEESARRSAYRLTGDDRVVDVEFLTRGDANHFPIALASIYSKYVRELFMHAFNTYWSRTVSGLRPTAGYYSDAQRWLSDVSGELRRRAIDRHMLVRER